MSANVGLSTPRGTGTSGYIQRSLSALHPRDNRSSRDQEPIIASAPARHADPAILAHERRRKIESSVFALRDQLEESAVGEEEIESRCAALRAKLLAEDARGQGQGQGQRGEKLKTFQSHDIAAAKIVEDERLRRALGIRGEGERERSPRRAGGNRGGREWDRARPRRERRSVSRSRSPPPPPRRSGGGGGGRRDWDRPRARRSRSRSPRRSRSRGPRRSESRSLSRSRSPRRDRDRDDRRPKTRRGERSRSRSDSRRRSPSRSGGDRD